MSVFRFQGLEVWQDAIEMSDVLLDIADEISDRRFYRFGEQLRGSVLSITNNIAEGSGSTSKKEFKSFLNYSRRSCFETANILIILGRRNLIDEIVELTYLKELDIISRKLTNLHRSL